VSLRDDDSMLLDPCCNSASTEATVVWLNSANGSTVTTKAITSNEASSNNSSCSDSLRRLDLVWLRNSDRVPPPANMLSSEAAEKEKRWDAGSDSTTTGAVPDAAAHSESDRNLFDDAEMSLVPLDTQEFEPNALA